MSNDRAQIASLSNAPKSAPKPASPPSLTTQILRLLTAQGSHARWDRWGLCCALDLRPSELEDALLTLPGWAWSDATTSAVLVRRPQEKT